MQLFRMLFLGGLVVAGAIAIFLGGVVMLTSWQSGAISWTYSQSGRSVTETVTRTADAARYWQLYRSMGIMPASVGALVMAFGLWALRRRR